MWESFRPACCDKTEVFNESEDATNAIVEAEGMHVRQTYDGQVPTAEVRQQSDPKADVAVPQAAEAAPQIINDQDLEAATASAAGPDDAARASASAASSSSAPGSVAPGGKKAEAAQEAEAAPEDKSWSAMIKPPDQTWAAFVTEQIVDSISRIPVPAEVYLINFRLGLCFWTMQMAAALAALYFLSFNTLKSYDPTHVDTAFWREGGDDSVPAAHCSDLAQYEYVRTDNLAYRPTGCVKMAPGSDYQKTIDEFFFMTLVHDVTTRKRHGAACGTGAGSFGESCAARGGAYGYDAAQDTCECKLEDMYFPKNQEKNSFKMRHGYKVQIGSHTQQQSSSMEKYLLNGEMVEGRMLTRILDYRGQPCELDGKSEFSVGDGLDIGGPLEDWLKCAGLEIDTQYDETRSFHPAENMKPHLRTTGAKLELTLEYTNAGEFIGGDIHAVCSLKVSGNPDRNSRITTDYASLEDPSAAIREDRYRFREAFGVSFQFKNGGSFMFFNINALITGVVNTIVLTSIPFVLTRLFALYGLGTVSKVYSKILRQKFSIVRSFHGLSARMMVASTAFRALTRQWNESVEELRPIKASELQGFMLDAFNHELRKDGNDKTIDEDEVRLLSNVVLAGLDEDNGGQVSFEEFVHACSSNEAIDSKTMVTFFDKQRSRWPTEYLFDPTREQIRVINDRMEQMKSRKSEPKRELRLGEEETAAGAAGGTGAAVCALEVLMD